MEAESFLSAIESFDVDTVEKLLKSDFEIEYRYINNRSVLHIAIELIERGITRLERKSFKHLNPLQRPEALRRIIDVILESGRFNVDALTDSCQTVLHLAVYNCSCRYFSSDIHKDLVNAIIELLLKNNANINAKTSEGETPLMMASQRGCSHIVQVLLDWRDEFGAGVDLNARDIFGQTALIKAAANKGDVNVIELLLQHGCLDEFHDHRGFYALHAVINGTDYSSEYTSSDFLAVIGVIASEETQVDRYASHSSVGEAMHIDWTKNDSLQEIVSMLVTRGRADINSKDFSGNTVLDLALKSKLFISQKTVEQLKEYGATSGALLNEHPENPNINLQYSDKQGKTPLHRLCDVLPHRNVRDKAEIFMLHLNSIPYKDAFEAMTVSKDHRGRTALHYAVLLPRIEVNVESEDIVLLINVMKLKGTINERDNYGRIPLHYCIDKDLYESLVKEGASEHIQDIDGKTPRDLRKLRNEELNRYYYDFEKINRPTKSKQNYPWMIWNDLEYAYRDQFSRNIRDKVQNFMSRLSEGIRKKDPRFECRPVLIGSAEEGTKVGPPDEFDFNFILTKLSEVCEVVPSPEAPSGFVHLKRRCHNAEYWTENEQFKSHENFDRFFNSGGYLWSSEIACRFRILYLQVLSGSEFWEGENFFEWYQLEKGCVKRSKPFTFSSDLAPSSHPCNTIQLKLNRPIEGRYMFTLISLDIVPCIKLNGWWPEETLSCLSDRKKLEGCHLVFDQPQRHYPWVPFSDPFARISFAPAESRMIKECSAVARAAYMVGKQLIDAKLTYVLKTCLLYCIEALKDCTRNSLLYEDINSAELRIFFEKLILCFNEFYMQDFLPCYMMPSFHLPIQGYLKSNHDKLLNDSSFEYPLHVFKLFRKVCTTESPMKFCPPTPEPLSEKFNREELMRKLSL